MPINTYAYKTRVPASTEPSMPKNRSQHPYSPLKEKTAKCNAGLLSPCPPRADFCPHPSDKPTQVTVTKDSTCQTQVLAMDTFRLNMAPSSSPGYP